ncbi:MAG: type II toxin-antitoxin system VapC family toxin [Spirochaetia bacterium]|nr:type II toxin-antitoxin system VapC family toxin [Spirochaetia bacterium]
MTLVLDASAAVQLILRKEKYGLYAERFEAASWVIAPDLFVADLSNVLWKYHRAGFLDHAECQERVTDGVELVDDFFGSMELWKEALAESIRHDHSAYDMFYAVLARRNDATLLSNDARLRETCAAMRVESFG